MRKLLLATTALLALSSLTAMPAQAEFILHDEVFAHLGATGFGDAPRLLTLQNAPNESGAVTSVNGATVFLSPVTFGANFSMTGVVCTSNGTCGRGGLRTGANESKPKR
jgi:hypothetical protein